ncbi:MAG: hypothetical protein HY785_15980 [Oscillatoriophycideae cyanobacterium NC_groundwater_1537_Pr4_S-0.65um_50_18]|nr:hypothetical protein [Oscillatoriophycideae cyanobacterium NC_groundwater_1537_Pr4_S-0.65um_50_18]
MSIARHHAEWLSLVEASGPFLSLPVLLEVFPNGLEAHEPEPMRMLKLAHEEWQDNQQGVRAEPAISHTRSLRSQHPIPNPQHDRRNLLHPSSGSHARSAGRTH